MMTTLTPSQTDSPDINCANGREFLMYFFRSPKEKDAFFAAITHYCLDELDLQYGMVRSIIASHKAGRNLSLPLKFERADNLE